MELQSEEMIRAEHLTFTYADGADKIDLPLAVTDVSFSVRRGEYVAVLGHNGSGKSTLAKLCNMILTPTGGKLYIEGRDVTDENFTEDDMFDLRRDVGMVFQNPDNQLVATVVEEDVAFGPENLGVPSEEIRRRVDEALKIVGMREYARHAPHKLSGGQKQRVAIAGVLAMKPKMILFDESTSMLDPLGRHDVVELMEKLNREEGITVLHITHYMEEAARADRIIVMNDGRIAADGTPRAVFGDTDMLHALGLEAPQGAELLHELRTAGWQIPEGALTEDECTSALLKFLSEDATDE